MITIPASFQIEERNEIRGGIENIERAGRTCYKSEDKAGMGKGDKFVKALINHHHEAMLEHGDYIFMVDDKHIWDNVFEALKIARESTGEAPMIEMTKIGHRPIISGNIRAWRELMITTAAGGYFSGIIDPLYTTDIREGQDGWFIDEPDPRVHRIFYSDLKGRTEKMAHQRQTVRFIVDRGISHEIVRHRLFSFAQESTRYCNYSQDKFGNQITVIEPCYLENAHEGRQYWRYACETAEREYFRLLDFGCTPQEARAVLPTSLKTEIVVTGNLREWQHFFDLRARQVTGPAHPQIVEVALPLYEMDKLLMPDVFAD